MKRVPLRGLSLLEALVANAVLIVGLSALALSLPLLMRATADGRRLSDADRVAVAVVEQMVLTLAQNPDALAQPTSVQMDAEGRVNAAGPFAVVATMEPHRTLAGGKRVQAVVTWTGPDGRAHRTISQTYAYVAPPPPPPPPPPVPGP